MLRGDEPAPARLLAMVLVPRKKRSIDYVVPGSEESRYFEKYSINANVGGEDATHILLREDPRTIEVLEEFLHGTQCKCGMMTRLEYSGPALDAHVRKFMIRFRKLLGISSEDVSLLQRSIEELEDG